LGAEAWVSGVRLILKDHQWDRMEPHLPGKRMDPGRTAADSRLFVEAVLWLARTGAPWRDLPELFGNWNSALIVHTQSTKRLALPLGASW
jgi:putative transposase